MAAVCRTLHIITSQPICVLVECSSYRNEMQCMNNKRQLLGGRGGPDPLFPLPASLAGLTSGWARSPVAARQRLHKCLLLDLFLTCSRAGFNTRVEGLQQFRVVEWDQAWDWGDRRSLPSVVGGQSPTRLVMCVVFHGTLSSDKHRAPASPGPTMIRWLCGVVWGSRLRG